MREKKIILKILIFIVLLSNIFLCACKTKKNREVLHVYNWGLYIDEECIDLFEKKYNVDVIYDMFDTNEEMFAVVKNAGRVYDVICPTDYMIEKMIRLDMLQKIDKNNIINLKNVDEKIFDKLKQFDKNNDYAIPYVYSKIGIIVNNTLLKNMGIDKKITSWSDLWDIRFDKSILMQDAMRDLLMVGLKKNNFSMNTKNINEINIAKDDLINQKQLVSAYVIDQIRDKMVQGDAALGVTYSGEVEYIKNEGYDLGFDYTYVIPEEGTNLTIDAWVIPKNAKNKRLAEKWIDFMCEKEIALKNFNVMHYGIPNKEVIDIIDEKFLRDEAVFPDLNKIDKYELYKDLDDFESVYNDCWKEIKSERD